MKTCKKCGDVKPLEEFVKGRNVCKKCKSEYAKKYCLENSKKAKERSKKWRLENPEKLTESRMRWHLKNTEYVISYRKEYYCKNTEKYTANLIKNRLKKQIGETPPSELVEIKVIINKTKRLCKTLKN